MKKLIVILLGMALVLSFTSSSAIAEDLSGKFGAGFSGGLVNALSLLVAEGSSESITLSETLPKIPFLSVKYHINSKIGTALLLGYNSFTTGRITETLGDDSSEIGEEHKVGIYGLGAKGFYNLIERSKINFYVNLGIIYQSGSHKWTPEDTEDDYKISFSEIDVIPGAGAEFFPVENLGISLEFGIRYRRGKIEYEIKPEVGDTFTAEQKFSGFSTAGSIFDVGIHYYFF